MKEWQAMFLRSSISELTIGSGDMLPHGVYLKMSAVVASTHNHTVPYGVPELLSKHPT